MPRGARHAQGEAYELRPTLANLACAAGVLLGQPGWDSLSRLQRFWNVEHGAAMRAAGAALGELHVDESRSGAYRPQLSDHTRMREVAALRLGGSRFGVDFLLELDPPIAIATHRRADRPWAPTKREPRGDI